MLGRLKMSIEDCITAYAGLSEKVFKRRNVAFKAIKAAAGKPWFDASVLEAEIRELIVERGANPDEMLKENSDPACKV